MKDIFNSELSDSERRYQTYVTGVYDRIFGIRYDTNYLIKTLSESLDNLSKKEGDADEKKVFLLCSDVIKNIISKIKETFSELPNFLWQSAISESRSG